MTVIEQTNGMVPEAIRKIIDQKGLKPQTVANRAGMKPQALNDILNHRRMLKPYDIIPIATALGVTPNDLFQDHG